MSPRESDIIVRVLHHRYGSGNDSRELLSWTGEKLREMLNEERNHGLSDKMEPHSLGLVPTAALNLKANGGKYTSRVYGSPMSNARAQNRRTSEFLEELAGGPLTFGRLLASIREGEAMSQVDFAKALGVSRSHLCDIEKERKSVGPARAARFAKLLGYPPETFVRLALQAQVEEAGLKLNVKVEAA